MKRLFLIILIFLSVCFSAFAEEGGNTDGKDETKSESKTEINEFAPLPNSYRGITLGMDIETVKSMLRLDSLFGYRGERDLSLLPGGNRSSISTAGMSYIERAWFQFSDLALYTFILKLNTDKIDYYSVYSHFCEKYGEPLKINPHRAIWENETVRVIIEKPLSIKYIDLTTFNKIIEQSNTETGITELQRENFIEQF